MTLKEMAGAAALDHVESGMRLGLGTGSTAEAFLHRLGARVAEGLDVVGVPTSERTASLARDLGIPLTSLDETPELDLTVDGADEIGPDLALIKGGGGALLREKIVASASRRMIVIADGSKLKAEFGAYPLPIEVVAFGVEATRRAIATEAAALGLGGELNLRRAPDGGAYLTDEGHFLIDASFRRIPDPHSLSAALDRIPGVVEHGLFLGLASLALVAGEQGLVTIDP